MQVHTLPIKRGWRWLIEGFKIYGKAQVMFPVVVLSYWMLMVILNSIPTIGPVIATVCIPVFSVSLMNVCRLLSGGEKIHPGLILSGFRGSLSALLTLGAIYLVAALAILGLASLIDGGVLMNLFVGGRETIATPTSEASLMHSAQLSLALFIPLMMAYWYAPVLVAWHGLPVGKSLFFSFMACVRNWRAFVAYGVSVFVFGIVAPSALLRAVAAFLPGHNPVLVVMSLLLVFMGLPVLYASFYVSYRDVFVAADEHA